MQAWKIEGEAKVPFSQLVNTFPKMSDQEVTTDIIKYEKYYRKMEVISFVNVEAEHQVKSKMNLRFISSACRGYLLAERALIRLPDPGWMKRAQQLPAKVCEFAPE